MCLLILTEVGTHREKADCSVDSFKARLCKLLIVRKLPCYPRVLAAVRDAFCHACEKNFFPFVFSLYFFFSCTLRIQSAAKLGLDLKW